MKSQATRIEPRQPETGASEKLGCLLAIPVFVGTAWLFKEFVWRVFA
jgi:hypothetical protein